jgi:hypothetical protein
MPVRFVDQFLISLVDLLADVVAVSGHKTEYLLTEVDQDWSLFLFVLEGHKNILK